MQEFIQELSTKMQTGEFSMIFLFASFLGGIIASLSPCSLGVLPIIAAYVGGYGETENEGKFLPRNPARAVCGNERLESQIQRRVRRRLQRYQRGSRGQGQSASS